MEILDDHIQNLKKLEPDLDEVTLRTRARLAALGELAENHDNLLAASQLTEMPEMLGLIDAEIEKTLSMIEEVRNAPGAASRVRLHT